MTDASIGSSPALSIALAVYNGERFVARALDSLLAQSFRNFELIISDDASTDRSGEICQSYASRDARIRYIRQPSNLGMYRNFDFLVHESRGPFYMWAAQDDEWDRDWCRVLMENMTEDAIISFGHLKLIGPANEILQLYRRPVYSKNEGWRTFQLFFQDLPWSIGSSPIYGICRRQRILDCPISEIEKLSRDSTDSLWVFMIGQRGHILTDDQVYHYKHAGYPKGHRPHILQRIREQVLVLHQVRMLTCFPLLVRRWWLRPVFAFLTPVRYLVRVCVSNIGWIRKVIAQFQSSPLPDRSSR
ncbi:MAG TPA: glycosyltransferase family 2 protein [Bryobacteraceae bacterium]|nr:glycosyltransferase family 2 protein [Bryobacteraceae bacterium]